MKSYISFGSKLATASVLAEDSVADFLLCIPKTLRHLAVLHVEMYKGYIRS